ncbi:MAG: glycosyltransferase family 9 protein, partial [Acidobacteria bacterium]|nr:glycosyltransferase family 9 protein [Acidobacteriota bacterium]
RRQGQAPRRILLLRLERIGDLLMTLEAIAAVRAAVGNAEIDLVIGSWNEAIARSIPGIHRVEVLDAGWLRRDGLGLGLTALLRKARAWRARGYDLAINFEGDIRSNLLLAVSGAPRRIGFDMAGGGSLLTNVVPFDPHQHVSLNTRRLVTRAFHDLSDQSAGRTALAPLLSIPDDHRRRASALLGDAAGGRRPKRPLVGIHPCGGRAIKQWHPERFAEVAAALRDARNAVIVLTGAPEDRDLVDQVKRRIGGDVIDLCGRTDLLMLAAVLERLDLFISGDTGPMHLAVAVGTPIVALFGPSDPARWGPVANGSSGPQAAILRVDLPCSPCNRIRQPPERCVGHVPDCLHGVETLQVTAAAIDLLDRRRA